MYKLIKPLPKQTINVVLKLPEGMLIPFAPGNRDYQEYLEWLSQGNEPEPADEAPE